MSAYRLRVRFHGANRYSRWLYRRCKPLGTIYYWLVRRFLTHYQISEDGKTWRSLCR